MPIRHSGAGRIPLGESFPYIQKNPVKRGQITANAHEKNPMTPLRAALAGVGRIADMHYIGYSTTPKAELAALCDVDPDLLSRRAAEWGVEKTYTDFDDLLSDPDVDAVDIITPHYLHAPMTIAALEAGKHVTVQKPMALSIAEADAMIEASERAGRLLRVIDNYRFHPPFVRARQILESGGIGEPMSIRIKTASGTAPDGWEIPQSSHVWRSDPTLSGDGSVLFDHGHHVWTIARYLLGDIERVFAYIGAPRWSSTTRSCRAASSTIRA